MKKQAIWISVLLTLAAISIPNTKAELTPEVITINEDGSVSPIDAPIEVIGNVYRFTSDYDNGLDIRKDDITIDGNFHSVGGFVNITFVYNVTLKNTKIFIGNTIMAILLANSLRCVISNNMITTYTTTSFGIYVDHSYQNTISDNEFIGFETGMQLQSSQFNEILENKVIGIGKINYTFIGDKSGIVLLEDSNQNVISRNILENNGNGIYFSNSGYNEITKNIITDNHYGLYIGSFYNNITRNIITNNVQNFIRENNEYSDNITDEEKTLFSDLNLVVVLFIALIVSIAINTGQYRRIVKLKKQSTSQT